METYKEYILTNNKVMPAPEGDILRFSDLHSWYKHLGKFSKAYPILLQGEEPRYDFEPCFTDPNKKDFHWRIVLESNINAYNIKLSETSGYEPIPQDIKDFMKKFPIYLDSDFSPSTNQKATYLRYMCSKLCEEFWIELKKNQ